MPEKYHNISSPMALDEHIYVFRLLQENIRLIDMSQENTAVQPTRTGNWQPCSTDLWVIDRKILLKNIYI